MSIINRLRNWMYRKKQGVTIHHSVSFLKNSDIDCIQGVIEIGEGSSFGINAHIGAVNGAIIIGKNVFMNRNCIVVARERITIGDDTIFGPNVLIYDHNHKFAYDGISKSEFNTKEIVIGKGCWIGAGCIILKGSIIGDGCVIGAGTVVNGIVPDHSLVKTDSSKVIIEPLYN